MEVGLFQPSWEKQVSRTEINEPWSSNNLDSRVVKFSAIDVIAQAILERLYLVSGLNQFAPRDKPINLRLETNPGESIVIRLEMLAQLSLWLWQGLRPEPLSLHRSEDRASLPVSFPDGMVSCKSGRELRMSSRHFSRSMDVMLCPWCCMGRKARPWGRAGRV